VTTGGRKKPSSKKRGKAKQEHPFVMCNVYLPYQEFVAALEKSGVVNEIGRLSKQRDLEWLALFKKFLTPDDAEAKASETDETYRILLPDILYSAAAFLALRLRAGVSEQKRIKGVADKLFVERLSRIIPPRETKGRKRIITFQDVARALGKAEDKAKMESVAREMGITRQGLRKWYERENFADWEEVKRFFADRETN
jgi:hypothetical protein